MKASDGLRDARFNAIFDTYYRALVSYCARIVDSFDVAEDVVVETFARLYGQRDRWDPDETARRFLYRAIHNASLDVIRTRETRARVLNTVGQDDVPGAAQLSPAADSTLEQAELLDALDVAVQRLSTQRRAVVTLRLEQGLRNGEIADLLGLSLKTVELHLSLALRDLRVALGRFAE